MIKRFEAHEDHIFEANGGEFIRHEDFIAALEAMKATVKPLEWEGTIAITPFGNYWVQNNAGYRTPTQYFLDAPGLPIASSLTHSHERFFGSPAEAKAAAQTDYEQRILSALVPFPALEANQQKVFCAMLTTGVCDQQQVIKTLRAALGRLLSACTRYDEDPTTLSTALYQAALEGARAALKPGDVS